ncbi:MAG: ribonuclease J, partial [Clostridia bacterium]|nr:ribonuclease J [Clostridia bacterium]
MNEEKKPQGSAPDNNIRTLHTERIKGVDVMVNRDIEKMMAAEQTDTKDRVRAVDAPEVKNEKKQANGNAEGGQAHRRGRKPAARPNNTEQNSEVKDSTERRPRKTKKVIINANLNDDQVSPSQSFIANPLASSQNRYRQVSQVKSGKGGEYRLKVIPLGGLGEVGKNMTVIQYGEDIIVVDGGLAFPEDGMFGIDLVIPDYSYLVEHRNNVLGFCLTHAHEDHIGGLPYVLKDIQAPVYGSTLTLGLLKGKLVENKVNADLRQVAPREEVEIGPFKVEFFRLTHSIPDSMGMAVHTPVGTILIVSDFKMDMSPIDGKFMDFGRISALGEKGVLLLLSDSTNVEKEGFSESERTVGYSFEKIFYSAKGRIIVTSFASHVHRVQQVLWAAERTNRKVAVVGRGMQNMVAISGPLGYLDIPPNILIDIDKINSLPAEKVVVITTGSQGEPLSGLTRMASGAHRQVQILPGDTVVISATPIPGNERTVAKTVDNLFRLGANVIHERSAGIHVSGHACKEELKMLLNMVKPRFFMPIHGEYRMLYKHALLAQQLGMPEENTFILENGQILELSRRHCRINGSVASGIVLIDGLGVGDVGNTVLKDRRLFSESGVIVLSLIYTKQKKPRIIAGPEIYSRGFIFEKEYEHIIGEMKEKAVALCTPEKLADGNIHDLRNQMRNTL